MLNYGRADGPNADSGASSVSDHVKHLVQQSNAYNTRRSYESMLRGFDAWRNGGAVDDVSIANYVAHLEETGKAVATARLALAAIRFRAKDYGQTRPDGPITAKALEGYGRLSKNQGRGQVRGIIWEQADEMARLAERAGSVRGLRDAALIAVMSDGLLRISEAAGIQYSDVRNSRDGAGRVVVARSKTDQVARGSVLYLRACTIRRVSAWTDASGISSGPLFRRVGKAGALGPTALSVESIRAIIQRWARRAGITGRVSGHSLRVGSAQSLVSAGATLPELQQAGRWLSAEMPAHYARAERAGRNAVARLRPDS